MPQVTKIKAQKNKKRVNLYLDGKFFFGLDADNFLKARLKIGQKLNQKQIDDLIFKNEFQKLLDRAFRLISRRPRSEKEISNYFKKKKSSSKVAEKVIAKLKELKQIDDREFARWWVDQRTSFRPRGKYGLTMELRQKGIDKAVIKETVESVSELRLAEELAQKKLKTYKNLSKNEFYRKMSAFLARRGFSWEVIRTVIAKYLENW
ncbi:MAG TPA: RecX family transcriptional regulator [Patescibacteria group bacterium]|nr:RecX family transcriptional regulator [Patescibacteria group bacterium]